MNEFKTALDVEAFKFPNGGVSEYSAGEQGRGGVVQRVEQGRSVAKRFEPEEERKLSRISFNSRYVANRRRSCRIGHSSVKALQRETV